MSAGDKTFDVQTGRNINQSEMVSISTELDIPSVPASQSSGLEIRESTSSTMDTDATTKSSEDVTEGHRMHQLRKGLERLVAKCVSAGR